MVAVALPARISVQRGQRLKQRGRAAGRMLKRPRSVSCLLAGADLPLHVVESTMAVLASLPPMVMAPFGMTAVHVSLTSIVGSTYQALAKVVAVCGLAVGLVPKTSHDSASVALSTVCFALLLPARLLVDTAATVRGADVADLLPLPAFAIAHAALGAALGLLVVPASGLRDTGRIGRPAFRQAVLACSFGNATTLPIVLLGSLCASFAPLAADPTALARGTGFMALYQLGWSFALWGIGVAYLAAPEESPAGAAGGTEAARGGNAGQGGATLTLASPGVGTSPPPAASPAFAGAAAALTGLARRLATPPSLGSLAGAAIGASPQASAFLLDADSPIAPVTDALRYLGAGCAPMLTLVLALSLSAGYVATTGVPHKATTEGSGGVEAAPSEMEPPLLPQLGAVIFSRGLAVPAAGAAGVWLANRSHWLPEDAVYQFVILLEGCMPTALALIMLAQVARAGAAAEAGDAAGVAARQGARLLLFQYAIMLLPVSLWVAFYLETLYG